MYGGHRWSREPTVHEAVGRGDDDERADAQLSSQIADGHWPAIARSGLQRLQDVVVEVHEREAPFVDPRKSR